jgi:hypothetical protein
MTSRDGQHNALQNGEASQFLVLIRKNTFLITLFKDIFKT